MYIWFHLCDILEEAKLVTVDPWLIWSQRSGERIYWKKQQHTVELLGLIEMSYILIVVIINTTDRFVKYVKLYT